MIAREWFENINRIMISWYVIHWFGRLIDYMIWSVDRIVCIRPSLERLTGWGAWCLWSEEGNWGHLFDGLFRFDWLTLLLIDWHDAIDGNQDGSYLKPGGWLCLRMMEWIIKSLTDYIIGDRPWNPRNPNSMLRNIASHHATTCRAILPVRLPLLEVLLPTRARGARTGNGLVSPFKLLNVFTSSRVRAGIFFAPRRGETPGTDQTC